MIEERDWYILILKDHKDNFIRNIDKPMFSTHTAMDKLCTEYNNLNVINRQGRVFYTDYLENGE